MTKYGKSVLEIINGSHSHPTAEQIFFEMKKKYPSVVMATVYNNLNSLHRDHKIRKLSIEGQTDRYDKNTRHDHLVCRVCRSVTDLHFHELTDELAAETGIEPEDYELIVYHTCSSCRQAEQGSGS